MLFRKIEYSNVAQRNIQFQIADEIDGRLHVNIYNSEHNSLNLQSRGMVYSDILLGICIGM